MDATKKLGEFRKSEGDRVKGYLNKADPKAYASGGKVKSGTTVNIVVGKEAAPPPQPPAMSPPSPPMSPPSPPMSPPPPPPAGGPPGLAGMGGGAPQPGGAGPLGLPGLGGGLGMKSGGRAYPIDDGSLSGPGRLQKNASEAKKEGHKPGYKKSGV